MDPELAAALSLLPEVSLTDIAAMRRTFDADMAEAPPVDYGDVEVHERLIPGPAGAPEIPIRLLVVPGSGKDRPGVLDIHGGGMAFGSPVMDDPTSVAIARDVGAVVASVDYRLAPEHPFPAGLDDCYAALVWFAAHAQELGVDPARIAVLGDSGGGNLATATALLVRDRGGPALAMQALIEPVLDDRLQTDSMTALGKEQDTVIWNYANAADSWRYYLDGQDASPYAAPARMDDLSGLPPTYLTVNELDPLRDEGLQYAQRLLTAGVPTELHCWPQAFHAFGLVATAAVSRRAEQALVGALRRGLGVEAAQGLSPQEVARIVADAPLDPGFTRDLDAAAGATIDEL